MLARYGLMVHHSDMLLLAETFQTDQDGSIELSRFVPWLLPDDDHDLASGTTYQGEVAFKSLGPQGQAPEIARDIPPQHDLPVTRQLPPGAPVRSPLHPPPSH